MKIIMMFFPVLLFGYVNGSVAHKDIRTKRDRKGITKIASAIFEQHPVDDVRIDQARKKTRFENMDFFWYQDPQTDNFYVNMWLAYDLMNLETHEKERHEEFLDDSCFTKKDLKKLRLSSFYKQRLQSKL